MGLMAQLPMWVCKSRWTAYMLASTIHKDQTKLGPQTSILYLRC